MMKEDRDFICELLDNVSKRIGKPYKYLAPFEEEYSCLKMKTQEELALMKASDSEFQKMGIPLRVAIAIREELGGPIPQGKKEPVKEIIREVSSKSKGKEETPQISGEKKLTEASMLRSIQILEDELMKKYPWVGQQLAKIFQTLLKIIKNIISDPYELKFRVLKKANARIKEIVLDNPPVIKFIKEIGFEEDEETFTLHRIEIHELYFLEEGIQAVSYNHQTQQSLLNQPQPKQTQQRSPFLPSDIKFPENKESVSLESAFSKGELQQANYAQVLDKLIEFRNQLMQKPPNNRQIKIYHKRHEVRQTYFQECNLEQEIETSDNSVIAKYWKNVLSANRNNNKFQSRRKNEFQYLIKQKIYKETIIKVRLPNELIIEARFGPLETLRDVFNLVSGIVIGEIYLYQSPPVKRLDKELHQNLQNLQSVPNGSFYLGINTEWYIKNQYASIIKQ